MGAQAYLSPYKWTLNPDGGNTVAPALHNTSKCGQQLCLPKTVKEGGKILYLLKQLCM